MADRGNDCLRAHGGVWPAASHCGGADFTQFRRQVIDQLDASLAIPQGDRREYVIAAASIIASVRLLCVPPGLPVDLQPCGNLERTVGPPSCLMRPLLLTHVFPLNWRGHSCVTVAHRGVKQLPAARFQHAGHLVTTPCNPFSGDAGQAHGAVRPLLAAVQLRAQLGPPGRPAPRRAAGEIPIFGRGCCNRGAGASSTGVNPGPNAADNRIVQWWPPIWRPLVQRTCFANWPPHQAVSQACFQADPAACVHRAVLAWLLQRCLWHGTWRPGLLHAAETQQARTWYIASACQ
jgi:hypothetical protein